ncbi:interleukin-36 gamma-like [Tenrec ecaudatus]|uniref:interleukin-36 gamma-like n=1 Tax=Tenrec ecaudatus TaxID=94439 RepID=UPI003F59E85D
MVLSPQAESLELKHLRCRENPIMESPRNPHQAGKTGRARSRPKISVLPAASSRNPKIDHSANKQDFESPNLKEHLTGSKSRLLLIMLDAIKLVLTPSDAVFNCPVLRRPHDVMVNPDHANITDLNHQVWFLQGDTLVAVPQSANVSPATVTFMPCKYPESFEKNKGIPIYLGIKTPERCLSCEAVEGKPTLKLKDKKILDLYNGDKPMEPFLFYHDKKGRTSTFESVAFPGQFIASSGIRQPIFLTSERGEKYNTEFDLDKKF